MHERTTLGLIGAGRLGQAMAEVWLKRSNANLIVWSRGGPKPVGVEPRVTGGTWAGEWFDVFRADAVLIAVSGRALIELLESHAEKTRTFEGRLYSAAVGMSYDLLGQLFPRATIVRVAPFLIDGTRSVPMLAMRPHELPNSKWHEVEADLSTIGVVDTVQEERVFDSLTLMGSPWPMVVIAMLSDAAAVTSQMLDEQSSSLGERLFLRALQSFVSSPSQEMSDAKSSLNTIATPSGLTAKGLESLTLFSELAHNTFGRMLDRSDEIRAETITLARQCGQMARQG